MVFSSDEADGRCSLSGVELHIQMKYLSGLQRGFEMPSGFHSIFLFPLFFAPAFMFFIFYQRHFCKNDFYQWSLSEQCTWIKLSSAPWSCLLKYAVRVEFTKSFLMKRNELFVLLKLNPLFRFTQQTERSHWLRLKKINVHFMLRNMWETSQFLFSQHGEKLISSSASL